MSLSSDCREEEGLGPSLPVLSFTETDELYRNCELAIGFGVLLNFTTCEIMVHVCAGYR